MAPLGTIPQFPQPQNCSKVFHIHLRVLPPPPRYPISAGPYGVGGMPTIIETNNILSHPEGPEFKFLVGEGEYVLKEDLQLATPPPHPSEQPPQNPNPLSTTPLAESTGTKLTLVNLEARGGLLPPSSFVAKAQSVTTLASSGLVQASIQEHPNESRYSTDPGALSGDEGGRGTGTSFSDAPQTSVTAVSTPAFGEGNALLAPPPVSVKDAGKKRKPKSSMTKSNSSFISRVINHDNLNKRLQERSSDGMFAFANINRAFQWLDLSDLEKKSEYLTKVLFTKAHCICHDVNPLTKTSNHCDVIMGFSTGDLIWWEPFSQKYSRINKNGVINPHPVVDLRWIPGSEQLFLAAHKDGSLVVYDKEKEDAAFVPEDELVQETNGEANGNGPAADPHPPKPNYREAIEIKKSVYSKNQKTNPVAYWKIAHMKINAIAFSPDHRHLAMAFDDGSLRIIDYLREKLLSVFFGYFGAMMCVCWSPDGKYIVTGGQDDLLHIWCMAENSLVAYCAGHKSWVNSVAFDPWRCDERNYRFGSVGDDCRLCLWDFNVGMLHRPRASSIMQHRSASVSSKPTIPQRQDTRNTTASNVEGSEEEKPILLVPQSRTKTAMLPPVLSKIVDKNPMQWLSFTEDAILASCKSGHIRTWNRPSDTPAQPET
ncbi:hypothetical protein MKZ38_004915 [Zalerion maritima]|uniref:Catabolite repression protein creC n=1 Tax=Zalerion maritima TaxID=339359 RepID=A0AAD5WWS5_9PEZI|nr:hypothetical protein MKZ38_004915 [Zalerion maritima]